MQIQTPAKINTQLHILKKREDGYHELFMHMVPISLFDTITITSNTTHQHQLSWEGQPCGDPQENLIIKAANAFSQHTGLANYFNFHLEKRIPVGAGLGGGSGNAGGVLQALNHFHNSPLTIAELQTLAATLGSDIPFFINPQAVKVYGRGERLEPFDYFPLCHLLVIKPPFSVSTAQAYRRCRPNPLIAPPQRVKSVGELAQSLANQFEVSLLPEFPMLAQIKQRLLQNGALAALVSGSGSAVFGVFDSEVAQHQALRQLQQEQWGDVFSCRTMDNYQYF